MDAAAGNALARRHVPPASQRVRRIPRRLETSEGISCQCELDSLPTLGYLSRLVGRRLGGLPQVSPASIRYFFAQATRLAMTRA